MLKKLLSTLAVTSVLATGAAFAAEPTASAPAGAAAQPATAGKAAPVKHHIKHGQSKAAPAATATTGATPAKAN